MQDEKSLSEAVSAMNDYLNKTDKINERLTGLCKTLVICMLLLGIGLSIAFSFAICYKDYAYFFSSYQYPTVEQGVTQDGSTQKVEQSIGKE